MNTFTIVITTTIILVTINTFTTLFQLQSTEKERVSYGYPPFSNFDYYYPLLSWLTGIVVLLLLTIIPFPPTNSIWLTIVYCLVSVVGYFLATILATSILSMIQARLVKKKSK